MKKEEKIDSQKASNKWEQIEKFVTLTGCFFFMLFLGSMNSTGNIAGYVRDYLNSQSSLQINDSHMFIILPGIIIVETLFLPLGSALV